MLLDKLEGNRRLLTQLKKLGPTQTQTAMLLLRYCAAPRLTYSLRLLSPDCAAARKAAELHDEDILGAFIDIV